MNDITSLQMVKSSNIFAIGYDYSRQVLFVQFTNTQEKIYCFYDVDESTYKSLSESKSIGSEFHKTVKAKFKTECFYFTECETIHGIEFETLPIN